MGVYKRFSESGSESRKIKSQERKIRKMLSGGETPHLIRLNTVSDIERYNMAKSPERMTEYHKALEQWQDETVSLLKASLSVKSPEMAATIKANAYTDNYDIINRLGFSFDRSAIYLHKGAGRKYGGLYGSKWTYLQQIKGVKIDTGIVRHTNPDSLGTQGTGARKAYTWFDPVISNQLPKLIEISVRFWDTMIVDATHIYIERL